VLDGVADEVVVVHGGALFDESVGGLVAETVADDCEGSDSCVGRAGEFGDVGKGAMVEGSPGSSVAGVD
jgi:hypothetical protein